VDSGERARVDRRDRGALRRDGPLDEGDPAALVAAVGVLSGLGMGLVVAAVTGVALVRLPGRR